MFLKTLEFTFNEFKTIDLEKLIILLKEKERKIRNLVQSKLNVFNYL